MRSSAASKYLPDGRCDFIGRERLVDHHVGAATKCILPRGGLRGQDDHRHVGQHLVGANVLEHLEPASPRHHHVEYDDVRPNPPGDLETLDSVVCLHELVAAVSEADADQLTQRRLVVADEHGCRETGHQKHGTRVPIPLKPCARVADPTRVTPTHDLPEFDARIVERYVETTYRKATAIFIGSVTAGVMIGAAFGATPLTALGSAWPIPKIFGVATMLAGAFIGGLIGYIVGDTRSFLCRLQGQIALAQVETAVNSRIALQKLEAIESVTRRLRSAPARQPAAPVAARPKPLEAAPDVDEETSETQSTSAVPHLRVAGSEAVPPPPLSPSPAQ
jgi:hypothetical protein